MNELSLTGLKYVIRLDKNIENWRLDKNKSSFFVEDWLLGKKIWANPIAALQEQRRFFFLSTLRCTEKAGALSAVHKRATPKPSDLGLLLLLPYTIPRDTTMSGNQSPNLLPYEDGSVFGEWRTGAFLLSATTFTTDIPAF